MKSVSTSTKYVIYGVAALLLLAAFYFFLFRGTDAWKKKLPVMGFVAPFSFTNQDGQQVSQAFTTGKVYVANYFFATCTGICPTMNGNMKKVYDRYHADSGFVMLSHTCQPEVDSLPMLRHYADSLQVDTRQWQFLTGNKLELYKTARESYRIDDPKNNVGSITDQFLHSQFIALVDRKGRVRGIYDGLKRKEMEDLQEDIASVLREDQTWGFGEVIFGTSKPHK
jgi:protein SCO1